MLVRTDTRSEPWCMILSWTALTHLIFCIRSSLGQMYQCKAQNRGALLSLPHKGHRKDVIPLNVFEDYIRDNVDKWFRWSKKMKLPVKHMEDLILVTVCTSFTSWAATAFEGCLSVDIAAISLEARKSDGGGARFFLAQHSWKRGFPQQSSPFPRLCLLAWTYVSLLY